MRYLLFFALLLTFTASITPARATDADEAAAHIVATTLGVYDPVNGDDRWVYTDTAMRGGTLIVSYRVQSATNTAVTIVRVNGIVLGRWERDLATNELTEVVFVNSTIWMYLQGLV